MKNSIMFYKFFEGLYRISEYYFCFFKKLFGLLFFIVYIILNFFFSFIWVMFYF